MEILSRLGVSISVNAINDAIKSLSRDISDTVRKLASTLLYASAYDNFDVDLMACADTIW